MIVTDDTTRLMTIVVTYHHRVGRSAASNARPRVACRWIAAAALVVAATLQMALVKAQVPSAPEVRTVPSVDLDRYAGDWFEIARYPNRFQRQCIGDVRASYARRPDGRVEVVNRCRTNDGETEARGIARVVDEQSFARLKVRFAPAWLSFLPLVWGDYWIIGLAPDYSWAVVGDPGREYLWILSRTPQLDGEGVAAARTAARNNGFDVTRLVPTPQTEQAAHDVVLASEHLEAAGAPGRGGLEHRWPTRGLYGQGLSGLCPVGSGFRVQGFGVRFKGSGFGSRGSGFGSGVPGSVQGFRVRFTGSQVHRFRIASRDPQVNSADDTPIAPPAGN
jgi:apolipoprotein D and lipocalin family protein